MKRTTISVLAGALLVSGAALAQTGAGGVTPPPAGAAPAATQPPASQPGTPAAAPAGAAAESGMKMADTATVAIRFVTVKPADVMATRLVGANVYNNQNESIGEVEDLVIENGKMITAVVVGVGGFLGLGESYVALDPSTVVLNVRDGNLRLLVNTSKDDLNKAPKFTYSKKK